MKNRIAHEMFAVDAAPASSIYGCRSARTIGRDPRSRSRYAPFRHPDLHETTLQFLEKVLSLEIPRNPIAATTA